ncbi:MAG: hypothetical protein AAB588_04775 [Patescibacteria group bacterium]
MIKIHKLIVGGSLFATLALVAVVKASTADVTLSSVVDIQFTLNSTTETCQLIGTTLSDFTVGTDTFHMTTVAGQQAILQCPSYVSLGSGTLCDTPGKSKKVFPGATTNSITLSHPTSSASPEFVNSCDGANQGSSGGGGGSSSGSSGNIGSVVAPPPPQTVSTGTTTRPVAETEKGPLQFSDLGKLDKKGSAAVLLIANLMKDHDTFSFGKQFKPNAIVNWSFALRVVVGGVIKGTCGADQRYRDCRKTAVDAGVMSDDEDDKVLARITRAEFYRLLLNAANIPIMTKVVSADIAACKDLKAKSDSAAVVATALKYKIATVYKGGKCNADLPLSRAQAMQFAVAALSAMKPQK